VEDVAVTPGFWAKRKVFLTGHTGFKGAWLMIWLNNLGASVRGFALPPPTEPSLYELAKLNHLCDSVIGDIRDPTAVRNAMTDFQPDIVIHMAAQSLVRPSYANPVETYATNVMGSVHVFEAARCFRSIKAIVNVTSDKVYENREWVWGYRECDAFGGHDPYSSSKGAAEIVAGAYGRSFFHEDGGPTLVSARAGNVIGGGDWATDRLLPDILRAFAAGEDVLIRQPNSIRPWQHVLEPLSGYLLLAEKAVEKGQSVAGGWNFGPLPDAVQTVRTVADRAAALWGQGRSWKDCSDPDALHEAKLLQLDSTKARVHLGWKSRWTFDEALSATVDWYRKLNQGADVRSLCESQIDAYARLL
jgi:CDP-glucose 4,6-dehydratase